MHIIMTPVGSSGDVNPFIALGRVLKIRGHHVTLIAPGPFEAVVSRAGLGFVSSWPTDDYEREIQNPDLWHPRRGLQLILRAGGDRLRQMYAKLEAIYEPGSTLLVGHTMAFATRVFEEMHEVPAVTIHLAPSVFRSDLRQPMMPPARDISHWPQWTKRVLWWIVDHLAVDPHIAPVLNAWRGELGLPPVSRVFRAWLHSPQRVLGLFPEWFGDPQPDWPTQLRLTGFVLEDGTEAPALEEGLERFLDAGCAPIVLTPGSANRHASPFYRTALEATGRLKRRALLVTPYREHLPAELPDYAYHVPYAPFSALLSRAAAIVHHGGIGTCAQGLAAGIPQVLMPMGFDQPDNALRVTRLGVGAMILPSQFSGATVAATLAGLLSSEEVAGACRRHQARINSAGAARRACDLIEEMAA